MRDLVPDHEDHWFEIYGKIALTGEAARFVNQASALGRWYDVSAYRIGGTESRKVAILFNDITTQKLNETQMLNLNHELELRVIKRTSELKAAVDALEAEMAKRQRLEREILSISEREQALIGQDLHDGICQDLAALAMFSEFTARKLEEEESQFAGKVQEITRLARQSVDAVRRLAAGLYPANIEENGLEWALHELAAKTSEHSIAKCNFIMREPIAFTDRHATTQIYRIAQEAVSNAVRHGNAGNISVELAANDGTLHLSISDDGIGLPRQLKKRGLGLHTMEYRASSLGVRLRLAPRPGGAPLLSVHFQERNSSIQKTRFPQQGRYRGRSRQLFSQSDHPTYAEAIGKHAEAR